jgi:hypothetical protein
MDLQGEHLDPRPRIRCLQRYLLLWLKKPLQMRERPWPTACELSGGVSCRIHFGGVTLTECECSEARQSHEHGNKKPRLRVLTVALR